MKRHITHISRVIAACASGAVLASIVVWLLYLYHPVERIPDDIKDTISTVFTGILSVVGGMLEHWRIDRKTRKLAAAKAVDDGSHTDPS